MTQKIHNPEEFLSQQIVKRGRSGRLGVYLSGLTVSVDPECDYGYNVNVRVNEFTAPMGVDPGDWKDLLIAVRSDTSLETTTLWGAGAFSYQVILEGPVIHLVTMVPTTNLATFGFEITEAQHILQCLCRFAGKRPGSIKIMIGCALARWEDLAESGEVEEKEIEFSY